jgi:hypothetical protein
LYIAVEHSDLRSGVKGGAGIQATGNALIPINGASRVFASSFPAGLPHDVEDISELIDQGAVARINELRLLCREQVVRSKSGQYPEQ